MENTAPKPDYLRAARQGLKNGLSLCWFIVKVVLPIYVASEVAKATGLLDLAASWLGPAMAVFNLPPGASVALAAGMGLGFYAGVAVTATLALTPAQVTVLGVMLGISHELVLETVVVAKFSPRYRFLLALRFGISLLAGWVTAWFLT